MISTFCQHELMVGNHNTSRYPSYVVSQQRRLVRKNYFTRNNEKTNVCEKQSCLKQESYLRRSIKKRSLWKNVVLTQHINKNIAEANIILRLKKGRRQNITIARSVMKHKTKNLRV